MSVKRICIIPARGGSKRIPRKNVKPFLGRPIIEYSIRAALDSDCFDEVMVSTDDPEIAEVARQAGAAIPFMRSAENSGDHAMTAPVVEEVLHRYSESGHTIELGCCVYATSVFVTPELFQKGLNLLDQRRDAPSVVSVTRFSFPVLRGLQMNEQSEVDFVWPEHKNTRSQDLAPCFHDAAQFYWFRSEDFLAQKNLFMPGSLGLEIPESEIQDIDNEVDWKLAELKFKLKYGEKTDE